MGHLRTLIMTPNTRRFRRLIRRRNIRSQQRSINHNPNNLMRRIPKSMSKLAEILCIMNWQISEKKSSMFCQSFVQSIIFGEESDGVDDLVESYDGSI